MNWKPLAVGATAALGLFLLAQVAFAEDIVGDSQLVPLIPDSVWSNSRKAEQQRMVAMIEAMFLQAGLSLTAAAAAAVNAYAESRWNPNAVGDSGHSIGLFQESDWGAGHGMTTESRKDPATNIQTILDREVLAHAGATFRQRAEDGADVAELAGIFSRDIERPKDKAGEMKKRAALAAQLFPSLVNE